MKKVLALLLALIMVLGLAACATKEAPAKTDDPAPADTTNTETTEQTPADATDTAESVTIKIWFHGSNVTPEASEKVMAELNPYLNEKIGVTLDPIWGTWGDFDTSTVTALAGGDDVDITLPATGLPTSTTSTPATATGSNSTICWRRTHLNCLPRSPKASGNAPAPTALTAWASTPFPA